MLSATGERGGEECEGVASATAYSADCAGWCARDGHAGRWHGAVWLACVQLSVVSCEYVCAAGRERDEESGWAKGAETTLAMRTGVVSAGCKTCELWTGGRRERVGLASGCCRCQKGVLVRKNGPAGKAVWDRTRRTRHGGALRRLR